jgi:hypothetical protein
MTFTAILPVSGFDVGVDVVRRGAHVLARLDHYANIVTAFNTNPVALCGNWVNCHGQDPSLG